MKMSKAINRGGVVYGRGVNTVEVSIFKSKEEEAYE